MKRKLDLETWDRKAHFEFFRHFEEPYHGVCVRIDCTRAYQCAKEQGISVFLYYLYQSLAAAQKIEAFRCRIEDAGVFVYDQIDAGSTIARSNGTFGYGHILYNRDLKKFLADASREVERVRCMNDLTRTVANNIIRYSALPWIDFTSLSHARTFSLANSCPSISFGKITEGSGNRTMPVSIHVHHALVDGLHVGQYIDCFQELMNQK